MTVDDVGQRGNRSWGSVRVVDSWPSKRRSTLLCSYHAISCCPLESGPRASSFLASFTVCKLYLHLSRDALSPCIAVFLVFQLWIESSVEYDVRDRATFFFCGSKLNEKREIISQEWIYRHPVYRHGRRGTLDSATIPTRHGNYTGNTVLPCASLRSPWMGWILNSQRPRENRRSLDNDCHVRHGSSVVLIDHLFAP